MTRSLDERLASLTAAATPDDDRPTLWAAHRTLNAALLAALTADDPPRSTWLVLLGHAVALAGRSEHHTHLAVLADRCSVTARTMTTTTRWLVDRRYLRRSRRTFGRGRRWDDAIDQRSRFARYGTISSHLLAVLAVERDRAALARTALTVAVMLGGRTAYRLTAADVAAVSGEAQQHARSRLRRLRDLDLLAVDERGRTTLGAAWRTP